MRDKREPLSRARVQDCAARGLCKSDAARELGVGCAWLGQFAAREGIHFHNERRNTEMLKKHDRIINLIKGGVSIKKVAEMEGCHETAIWARLRRVNLPSPGRQPRPRKSKYTQALLDAQARGLSNAEFCRETGMSAGQVSDLCRNLGIVLRNGRLSRNKGRQP